MELPDWALPAHHRIGSIELQAPVHVGTAGVLYRGWDHATSVCVAVEEYLPHGLARRLGNSHVDALDDPSRGAFEMGRQAFADKARTLSRCDHPSLLRVLQVLQANGTAYSVMPWYMGRPMTDMVGPEHPLPEVDLRSLLADLLGALHAYHRHGGLHGDVRPAKVLLLDDGHGLLLGPDGAAGTTTALRPTDPGLPGGQAPAGPQADLQAMALLAQWSMGDPSPTERIGIGAPARRTRRSVEVSYSAAFRRWLDGPFSSDPNARPHSAAQFRHWLLQLPDVDAEGLPTAPSPAPTAAPAVSTSTRAATLLASVLAPADALVEPPVPLPRAPARPPQQPAMAPPAAPQVLTTHPTRPAQLPPFDALDAVDRPPATARSSTRPLQAALVAVLVAAAGVAGWSWWVHQQGRPGRDRAAAVVAPQGGMAPSLLSATGPSTAGVQPVATTAIDLQALAQPADAAASAADASAGTKASDGAPAPASDAANRVEVPAAAVGTAAQAQAATQPLMEVSRNEAGAPRAQCGERTEFSLYRCMQQQCAKPRWQSHAECVRFRSTDTVS